MFSIVIDMNTKNCKEELIEITTTLIRENKGDVDKVTIRDIANKSGVSVGLINYHFGNKDNLITECVQRIVGNVVYSFQPILDIDPSSSKFEQAKARVTQTAKQVFDFLFSHPSISKVSILGDLNNYSEDSNSNYCLRAIMYQVKDAIVDIKDRERFAFSLASLMQAAFLRSLTDTHFLGLDFSIEKDRNKYIEDLINQLMKE